MKKITWIIFSVLLLGCATEKGYQQYLSAWQDADTLTLVRTWGPPEEVYALQGHDFYVYNHTSYENNPNYPYTCPDLDTIEKNDTDLMKKFKKDKNDKKIKQCIKDKQTTPREIFYHCKTTFEIVDNKVIGYRFDGNNCVK